ncbi:MAG: hypothetical protein M1833_002515 [Piccolia ochrophora]|nr:MAG: hypothetical protein M1833_002515 [Piccolia ochrophora]
MHSNPQLSSYFQQQLFCSSTHHSDLVICTQKSTYKHHQAMAPIRRHSRGRDIVFPPARAAVNASDGPTSDGPVFGGPVLGGPVSGGPVSGGPVSGGPVSGGPVSGGPVSGGGGSVEYGQGHQDTDKLSIDEVKFRILVREIVQDLGLDRTLGGLSFQVGALLALQESAETYLTFVMETSLLVAEHKRRITVQSKDIRDAVQFMKRGLL